MEESERERVRKKLIHKRRFRLVFCWNNSSVWFNSRVYFIVFFRFFSVLLRNKLYFTIITRPMQQIKLDLILFLFQTRREKRDTGYILKWTGVLCGLLRVSEHRLVAKCTIWKRGRTETNREIIQQYLMVGSKDKQTEQHR